MDYLTQYYKNLSEQLQQKINILQKQLDEVVITKVVNGKTVSWDPSKKSEIDAEIETGVRSEKNRDVVGDTTYRANKTRKAAQEGGWAANIHPQDSIVARSDAKHREEGGQFDIRGNQIFNPERNAQYDREIESDENRRMRDEAERAKIAKSGQSPVSYGRKQ